MADQPSLQIDDDWKKQAQEEKRRLAEQTAAREARAAKVDAPTAPSARRDEREAPVASFATLVRSIMTQALLYLGDLAVRGGEQMVNLDMARFQIDMLSILEDKCKGNLTADEQRLIDGTLYDLRTRFVSVASQYVM